ncbi:MAG: hypothetical protein K2J16_02550, partial [Clostridia bacterium]|nr:hypothetical protein [Clostridia bacterium]
MEKTTEQLLQELISKFSTFLEKVDITTFSIAEKLKTHRDFIESMSGDIGTLNGNIDLLCTRVTKLEQSQKTVKEQSEQAADLAE